jgi:predicted nucleotidyltransferase
MDKTDVLEIASRYADEVRGKFDTIRIILFGSYAKGNYHDDSDIDIAIIFKDYNSILDMQLELMRLRRKVDSRIEPHPFRERDFDLSDPVVNEILKYGKDIRS